MNDKLCYVALLLVIAGCGGDEGTAGDASQIGGTGADTSTGGASPGGDASSSGGRAAGGASSGGETSGGTGGQAAGGDGTGGAGGSGAVANTGGTAGAGATSGVGGWTQERDDQGHVLCADRLCGYAMYCCNSPCASCVLDPETCGLLVCGTGEGGTYETYPSDCGAFPSGDSTFCGVAEPLTPHSIHYYQCTTSVLAFPCTAQGGGFCCPGSAY